MAAERQLEIHQNNLQPLAANIYQQVFDQAVHQLGESLPAQVSLSFVDEATMSTLNREHTGNDYATDVLSYNFTEEAAVLPHEVVAEIVICPPVAQNQAQTHDNSLQQELLTLFAHGLVHIAGHDHATSQQKEQFDALLSAIIPTTL